MQWNTESGSLRSDGPMQVMILPDQIEIMDKPQVLKKVGDLSKKKNKTPVKKKQNISSSIDGTLKNDEQMKDQQGSDQPLGDGEKVLKASYAQALFLYFSQNKSYPRKARKLNQTGTVSVKVHITADGVFQHIHLEKGCDHSTLNKAAVNLIQKLGKFKPLPKKLGSGEDFTVPIEYTMSRGT